MYYCGKNVKVDKYMSKNRKSFGYYFKALGRKRVPEVIALPGMGEYNLDRVFKHDFFACTALYKSIKLEKIVVKINRVGDFMGLPLRWLGRHLCDNEVKILRLVGDIDGTPNLVCRLEDTGFAYEYIEGETLAVRPELGDSFFDELEEMVGRFHARKVVYLDMNKRGNIIVGLDGRPKVVDFQISQHIDWICPFGWLGELLLNKLKKEDVYHIRKHKRRLAKHLMTEGEIRASRKVSFAIRIHRVLTRPLTQIRRKFLYFLHKKGILITDDIERYHCESDPARWGA